MATKLQTCTKCLQKCKRAVSTDNFKFRPSLLANSKFATAFILIVACKNISGFSSGQAILLSHRRSTAHYFRHESDERVEGGLSSETDVTAAAWGLLNAQITPAESTSLNERMPIWLRQNKVASSERKLIVLRHAMEASSLTPRAATVVEASILEAARGDFDKIAGAVDFCHIMLETMEMGVSALVAACFHYCSCYGTILNSKAECPELNLFPAEVISIVKNAAQLKKIEHDYASIDTLNSGNLQMLLLARTNNWNALAIRSAASLHRLRGIIRNCIDTTHETVGATQMRAARQAIHIYAPLASQLGMHRLKNEIEGAAFQILYRRQYAAFNALMCKPKKIVPGCHRIGSQNGELESFTCLKDDMNRILAHATEEVTRIISEDPSFSKYVNNITVTARVKESYSLWKKALKLGAKSILDVPDALALRIVVNAKKLTESEIDEVTQGRDRLLCYCVHQICSKHFKPLEGSSFKNYIANPKSNGYQSLHYTTCTEYENEKYPLEIQIRSQEMHQVADFGLAAHWYYKYKTKSGNSSNSHEFKFDHSTAAYLSACGEWQWQHAQNNAKSWKSDPLQTSESDLINSNTNGSEENITPFIKALEVTQSNLTRQKVYIFLASQQASQQTGTILRDGKLLELPAGACVLDALRESDRTLGFSISLRDQSLAGIIHNDGALTSLTQKLKNGDILTIPVSAQRRINNCKSATKSLGFD